MGVVWLASDEFLHRDVAIKEIQRRGRELRETDPEVRRALREARAAAKLSGHPGIVTVHDVVTDEHGLPWIVMQLLDGRSLDKALAADGPMPVRQAARIGVQVLKALEFAHNAGVLHRDVKPGNVMLVGEDGVNGEKAVLTDFGIAVIDGASALTATGQIPGAPEYIAPERSNGSEALPAADLWSVGIMLYRMVVGRTPFHRSDAQTTVNATLSRDPDPDPRVGRMAPVIEGLLRKKPAERMTAKQAIDKLSGLTGLPPSVPNRARLVIEYPTELENPGGEHTLTNATVPNTRLNALPFFPRPPTPPRGAPDVPSIAPNPPGRSGRQRGALIASGAIAVAAAIVVTVVLVGQSKGDDETTAPPTSGTQTTVEPGPLTTYPDPLGFEIAVPADWRRSSSIAGPLTDVVWEGRQTNPKVGALTVRVLRDETSSGVSVMDYLSDEDQAQQTRQDYADYQRKALSDNGDSADLEYTYRTVTGQTHFHVQVRAVASEEIYTLTFTMFASDAETLRDHWQATRPLIADIRDSFRLTS